MTTQTDESTRVEHTSEVQTVQRDESSDVWSFSDSVPDRKPLGDFEAPPATTAPPLTWGSGSS